MLAQNAQGCFYLLRRELVEVEHQQTAPCYEILHGMTSPKQSSKHHSRQRAFEPIGLVFITPACGSFYLFNYLHVLCFTGTRSYLF
ncbi:MAG: hypothetical protein ACRC13_01920 [Tannerellaceae bacterium]